MADGNKRLIKCRTSGFSPREWQNSRVRFTHNEIERKRRARLKSETDFLHQQLPKAVYRDKLAIFKAGTDLLLHYSNLGGFEARNLILTDNEYSECILDGFEYGFGMRIRCEDGIILQAPLTGKSIYDIVVPNDLTDEIIRSNLSISSDEREQLSNGQLISRSFVLPISSTNGSQVNGRLLECCGDIALPSATSNSEEAEPILQMICCLIEDNSTGSDVHSVGKVFSLRLQPETHLIVEFQGQHLPSGLQSEDILNHTLGDLCTPESRSIIEANLQNAERTGEASFKVRLGRSNEEFLVVTKAINVCDCLHCLIVDFYPPQY